MKKALILGIIALSLLSACDWDRPSPNHCCGPMDDTIVFTLADDSPAGAIIPGGNRRLMAIDITCRQESCGVVELTFIFSANPNFFNEFWLEDDRKIISLSNVQIDHSTWTLDTEMVFTTYFGFAGKKRIYLVAPLDDGYPPGEGVNFGFQPIFTYVVSDALYGWGDDVPGNIIYAEYAE